MKSVEISRVQKTSNDYLKMSSDLIQNHKGQWDDPVHDSFVVYNKLVKNSSDCITKIYKSTQSIADSSFDNKVLIDSADRVLSEVRSL